MKTKGTKQYSAKKQQKKGSFPSQDLCNTNPLKQQFEPTDSNPIPQHKRMAGA